MRTYAADFLNSLCQFQDGTLTKIFEHAFEIIENKTQGKYSKSTMLIVITCLRYQLKERKDLKVKIAQILTILLDVLPVPVVDERNKKEEDIEYAYVLLCVSKFVLGLKDLSPKIIELSFRVGFKILENQNSHETYKCFVLDIFTELSKIDEG